MSVDWLWVPALFITGLALFVLKLLVLMAFCATIDWSKEEVRLLRVRQEQQRLLRARSGLPVRSVVPSGSPVPPVSTHARKRTLLA